MSTRFVALGSVLFVLLMAPACRRGAEQQKGPAAGSTAAQLAPARAPAASTAATPATPAASQPSEMAAWHGFIPEAGPVVTGRALKMSDLTETEQKYGVAPARDANVLYQDQVVVVEHGDKAIKSWDANGMGWTLDGSDPRISALKEGDVLFATSRCVGRVLKLTRTGNDVAVILGPAQFTDVIKQGNLTYDQPLDLNSLTAVEMPDYPGAIGSPYLDQMKQAQGESGGNSGSAGAGSGFAISNVTYYVVSSHGDWRPMRTAAGAHARRLSLEDHRLATSPSVVRTSWSPASQDAPIRAFNNVLSARPCFTDCGGLGVTMTAKKDGLNLNISVVLKLQQPRFSLNAGLYKSDFHAAIMLTGGAGFEMTVVGTTDLDFTTNLNQTGAIPVDLVLPLAFGGVPLELHYHQDLSIATGFSAKTSVLKSSADFMMHGNLGFIYQDGHFEPLHLFANPNSSLSDAVNGISMGINSVVVAIDQRLLAGLGAGGFAVGPYAGLQSTLTALKQATSAASMTLTQQGVADCRQATFQMLINGGIGYAIPKPVAAVINFFLKLVHAAPIAANGSFARLTPVNLFDPIRASMPPFCAGK